MGGEDLVEQAISIVTASRTQSNTPQSVGFLWTSDQPDKETSTRHKKRSEYIDIIFRRDLRSQQTTGRRPTPWDRATTGIGAIDSEANMNNGGGRKIMYSSTGLRYTFLLKDENRHSHFTDPRFPRNSVRKTLLYPILKYVIRQHRKISHDFFPL